MLYFFKSLIPWLTRNFEKITTILPNCNHVRLHFLLLQYNYWLDWFNIFVCVWLQLCVGFLVRRNGLPVIQRGGLWATFYLFWHSQDGYRRMAPMRISAWIAWRWLLDSLSRVIMEVSTPGGPRRDRTNQNLLQPARRVPPRGCCLSKRLAGC